MASREGAQTSFCTSPQSQVFTPTVVDGVLLPKMPEEILAEKKFNTVPYLLGVNKQEFGWLLPMVRMCEPLGRASPPVTPPPASDLRICVFSRSRLGPGQLSPLHKFEFSLLE